MGAYDFWTVSHGTNIEKAFSLAVVKAKHAYGHSGYTGTIAEKSDYRDVTKECKTKPLRDKINSMIADKRLVARDKTRPKPDRLEASAEVRELLSQRGRLSGLQGMKKPEKIKHIARVMFDLGYGEDKWGPAMAVKLEPKTWLFFGMASS